MYVLDLISIGDTTDLDSEMVDKAYSLLVDILKYMMKDVIGKVVLRD